MSFLPIDGRAYHYRDVGEGRPVLLLHGFPLTGSSFWPQLDAVPEGVRLIVPDHRGFGQSARGEGALSIAGFAADAFALLDALKVSQVTVGGVSMEVETKGLGPLVEAMLPKLLAAKAPDDVRRRVEAMMRSVDPQTVAAASRAMAGRADSREILSRFAGPSLVVVGSEDVITPPAKARELAALMAGSRRVELEGAGHLSNLEKPEAFNAALAEFLAY